MENLKNLPDVSKDVIAEIVDDNMPFCNFSIQLETGILPKEKINNPILKPVTDALEAYYETKCQIDNQRTKLFFRFNISIEPVVMREE